MTSWQKEEASLKGGSILGREVLFEISRVRQKLVNSFKDEIRVYGLTFARAKALLALAKEGDLTQKTVAAYLEIEGPSAVRLIDDLEKGGFVLRQQDVNDRRIKNLILTESGTKMAQLLNERWQDICDRTVGSIDVSAQKNVLNTMKTMLSNLNK